MDYHIEANSRWKSRLQQNGGAVNISVKQSAQTSFGTGYKTDYTVKIGGQSSHIHCESSYDGSAKVPSYDDAGCNHNTP